jgi:L-seryl-tRNA(Ser) seleniumtransferase
MADTSDDPGISSLQERLRALPAISAVLEWPSVKGLISAHGRAAVVRSIRGVVESARAQILEGEDGGVTDAAIEAALEASGRASLRPVLNATGVIVHTNLGRAPLARAAREAVDAVAGGYSTLEYALEEGRRGSRHDHCTALLRELTGAEAAAVVNNNAGAVMLALAALARAGEVVVSRGELVEIGGGFRVPDIMAQSGARLVEVGTTNRTRASDYAEAIGDETALLLKVHRSNFALVGFTEEVSPAELADVGHAARVPVMYDAGSGCLEAVAADPGEMPVRRLIEGGVDLVTFSGDKLLGGPQAGVIVGRADLVDEVRKHPLMRALRPDKMCIAALHATLRLWRDDPESVPVVAMMRTPAEALETRAVALAKAIFDGRGEAEVRVVSTTARIGGGASPLAELPSFGVALAVSNADALAARLREGDAPVIVRIDDDDVVLDLRTVPASEDESLATRVRAALGAANDG